MGYSSLDEATRRWLRDPTLFVRNTMNVEPDDWQCEALCAIRDHDLVSIRSGHGIGKSAFLAWAILWFLYTRYPAKTPCTAPTAHQLSDVLWAELATWWRRMPTPLRQMFVWTADRFFLTTTPKESFAVARTARKEAPEAFQGFHSSNLLFIADEASGIDDLIFEVGEGSMSTAGAKTILTGNPTRLSGYFYDSHHRHRARWHTMHVSSENARMVSSAFIADMRDKHGESSNIYRVRVLGDFPLSEDDVLISLSSCEQAVGREIEGDGERVWGLDVARFGDDDSALAKRWGRIQEAPTQTWHGKDTMELVGLIVDEYRQAKREGKAPNKIVVDAIGIGAGVADRLIEQGYPAVALNVSERATQRDGRFLNLRAELFYAAKDWLESEVSRLEDDADLIGEMSGIKYKMTSTGKLQIESKEDMKARGLPSPNRADAWALTFAEVEPARSRRRARQIFAHDPIPSAAWT